MSFESEVSNGFEVKHKNWVQEAEQRGEEDGKRNHPPVEDMFPTPYEQNLRAKYQSAISDLFKRGSQRLQEIYDQKIKGIEKQIKDIQDDPELIQKKIRIAAENCERQLEQANNNHLDKLKEIENEPLWQSVKKSFDESKQRFDEIALKHKRRELYIHLRPVIYIPLLIFIAVCEIPINYQVFVAFRETPLLTLIMAGVLVISLPFLAHGSGKFLRQFKENKTYLMLLLISVILIVSLSYYTAVLRKNYLFQRGVPLEHLQNDLWTFFIISLVLYFVGTMASFLAHDPSIEFYEVYQNHMTEKMKYEKKLVEKHSREKVERERFEVEKHEIQNEFTRIKSEWDNMRSTLDLAAVKAAAEYDKVLVYLQGCEKEINNCFKQAIQLYRDKNMTFRNNHAQPKYWGQDTNDLDFEFQKMKELSENPRI